MVEVKQQYNRSKNNERKNWMWKLRQLSLNGSNRMSRVEEAKREQCKDEFSVSLYMSLIHRLPELRICL